MTSEPNSPYGNQQPYAGQQSYGQPPGGPQWGQQPRPGWGRAPVPQSEESLWSVLSHVSYFVVPLLGPLVLYLVYRDRSRYIRHHATEALNFHITLAIASVVSAILVIVIIGFFLLAAIFVAGIVLTIVAAIAASRGEWYRYPLTLRLVH